MNQNAPSQANLPALRFLIDDKYEKQVNDAEGSPTFVSDIFSTSPVINRQTMAQQHPQYQSLHLDQNHYQNHHQFREPHQQFRFANVHNPNTYSQPPMPTSNQPRGNYWEIVMCNSNPRKELQHTEERVHNGVRSVDRTRNNLLISKPRKTDNLKTKPFPCGSCEKSFDFKSHLKTHRSTVHLGKRDHHCHYPGCGSSFGQKSNLNKHIRVVHQKLKPHGCKLCPKKFSQRSVAKAHFKSVHLKQKDHKCPECDQPFSDRSNLKKHIKLVHLREKNHVCDVCDKSFGEKRSLMDHKSSVHMKIKPYACWEEGCGAIFGQKSHLSTHHRTMHLRSRPFKCHICFRPFGQRAHLDKHIVRCRIVEGLYTSHPSLPGGLN